MKIERFKKLENTNYPKYINAYKMIRFIYDLQIDKNLDRQVNLFYINVNDWNSSIYPCVYVHNKERPFRVKKYHRCSAIDLKNAIKFHFTKNVKTKETVYGY